MATLNSFPKVEHQLSTARVTAIRALHKFVFDTEGDRNNRKRLRSFQGFDFNETSQKYVEKENYIKENLTTNDLILICNILGLDHNNENLIIFIFKNLIKDNLLANVQDDDDEEEEEEENIVEENIVGENNNNNENAESKAQSEIREEEEVCSLLSATSVRSTNNDFVPRFSMNFHDIQDTVRQFDGTECFPVETWVKDFEETAGIMHWNDFQKYVFAKRSITGIAKLFIRSERNLTSWKSLRSALLKEFKTCINSAKLHKLLVERKVEEKMY